MPFDPTLHVIHTAGGRLSPKSPTSAADVRRIVGEAVAAGSPAGIVLNFHGGLVNAAGALEAARQRLYPLYAERAGAYPIFFVWESGFFESPLNNLAEIAHEPLFRAFVAKVGAWVLRRRSAAPATRAIRPARRAGPQGTAELLFRRDLARWFAAGASPRALPARLRHFPPLRQPRGRLRRAAAVPDAGALAREIEADIAADHRFRRVLAATETSLHPSRLTVRSAWVGGRLASSSSLIDKEAAARLFTPPGAFPALRVRGRFQPAALVVARVVWRVLRREFTDRDHGFYVTLVEEVLRELYVGRVGRSLWWERMKGDTADAFRPGDEYGGTVFLSALQQALAGREAPRITLIGHSTGALYIGNFLRAAAEWVPDLRFDVILEAPAITHDLFARVIEAHGSRLRKLRIFGMGDAREQDDTLVPVVYPASLLYFVSGLLEDEADQPLLGMQRFLARAKTFTPEAFPNIAQCRQFLAGFEHALAWSPQSAPSGCATDGRHHQDFDDHDAATLASIEHILKVGY